MVNLHSFIVDIPAKFVGAAFLGGAWFLISKRPRRFSRLAKVGSWLVLGAGALDLMFGPNISDMIDAMMKLTRSAYATISG
jgi:hypothetical protein